MYLAFLLLRLNQMLYALCLSYHSNTGALLFACLSSRWATTFLASRWEIALSVFLKVATSDTTSGVEPRFRNLSITIARRSISTEPRRRHLVLQRTNKNKFQIFRLNFCWDMSKMHYFSNKFSKIAKRWGLSAPSPLTFDVGDLKLRDLTKLWFFKLIMMKSNLKKISFDIISVASSQLRHRKIRQTERHKIFPLLPSTQSKFKNSAGPILSRYCQMLRFHVPFWLSHILGYLIFLYPSLCPS